MGGSPRVAQYDRSAHGLVRRCPAGRAARARARARAGSRGAALRRPASQGSPGHRGCRGDGEVTAARGGTRAGVGPRPARPCGAATELERGFPFGVVQQLFERPLLEADAGERERWLAGAAALAVDVLTRAPPAAVALTPGPAAGDPGYAWQHGLYWLASNLAAESPLALVIDDLQWCDAPSARALAFIARPLEGQPLALIVATRPLDPALMPEAAALVADPAAELLRASPLTQGGGRRTGRRPPLRRTRTIGSCARASRRRAATRSSSASCSRNWRLAASIPSRPPPTISARSSRAASPTRSCSVWHGCRQPPPSPAHAVRYSGLDITVHQSDQRRAPGHPSRQGPPALCWALFEAAQTARRTG
jgi:Transposase IS116/IS110/IS902 family